MADDSGRVGPGRAALRWSVIRVPMYLAALVGTLWLGVIWWIVVYGPILLTPLRQGLHDRAAGVVVITSRHLPPGWTFTNAILGRVRRERNPPVTTTNRQVTPASPERGARRYHRPSCECRT